MNHRKQSMIIAEAGVNHNGDINKALQLIDVAAEARADYVKFQTFKAEKVVTSKAVKAAYQIENTGNNESQLEMIKKLQLSEADHFKLLEHCRLRNIGFLSTPFDLDSIDMLVRMGVTIGKVPSGEINNVPYLRKMGANFESIILSTGMSTMEEIAFAIDTLQKKGVNKERITVLHCNTEYPTPFEDVNLAAMITIRDTFKVNVGYSDHTIGLEVPLGAITLGAVIIEKHFTLDKSMEGPDHKASLDPLELKNMVTAIRNLELAMGSDQKKPSPSEQKNIAIARRSIVAARPIKRGEIFSEENLTVKRPGTGISPMHWDNVIGQLSDKDYQTDDLISL